MKKHILFAIRYSVIIPKSAAWTTSSLSTNEQINQMLSPERLNFREHMLANITLASIASNQCEDTNVTVLIMVSDLLSPERISRLNEMCNRILGHCRYFIVKVKSGLGTEDNDTFLNINEAIKFALKNTVCREEDAIFSTVRIDDDDGISSDYVMSLSNYLKSDFCGHFISFSYGLEGFIKKDCSGFECPRHLYFPKLALGLAYINRYNHKSGFIEGKTIHAYNAGDHMTIDERFPVIVDARRPMFFRTLSKFNDSGSAPNHDKLPKIKGLNIICRFSFLKNQQFLGVEDNENWSEVQISRKCSYAAALAQRFNDRIKNLEKRLVKAENK